jgi:hypothetical protein
MTTATAATRAVVEDRYKGLMFGMSDMRQNADWTDRNYIEANSELFDRLDDALTELMFGLVRHDIEEVVLTMVQELHVTIEARAVELASVDVAELTRKVAAA